MTDQTASPVRIVGGPPLTKVVPLTWQYEHDGKVWTEITVRRMTVAEVDAFTDEAKRARAAGEPDPDVVPVDCPDEVLQALLPDDREAVEVAVDDFLPLALRVGPSSPLDSVATP